MKATNKRYSIPGGQCTAFEANKNGAQSIAVVEQNGRFPKKGFSVNSICTETIIVLKGKFVLCSDGEDFVLKKGDVFYIEPGIKYSISGEGVNLVAVSPAWDSKQNRLVPK